MASTVPYQTFYDEDEIAVNEDDLSVSDADEGSATESHLPGAAYPAQHANIDARINQYMDNERWPRKIGIIHLLHGILLLFLGLAQVILIPFIESSDKNPVHLNKQNLYGLGIWSGLILALSGAIATRAAIHHSNRADSGALFGVHIAISTMILFAYMLVLHAFMQYYEEVLCGQFQLCRKMVHCCCPRCCPRVVSQDELADARTVDQTITERPPSLPV
ncbi:hypothetical protein CAPTEDRAFT_216777 [Capitella teleta]|uniref:Uncharacterized protein n=1 Tax=Capitella teleta TaxID=283909 RepID=R7V084_CAPTE|nr:hypothetical protein CAPTEDRAFT_216777 [Capitella teleta]|eukprot:ELU11969.1 hypothetical protein CAPTEDRAFT_216777 [Capitella teleta]